MTTLKYLSQYFTTALNVGGGIDDSQTTGIILLDVSGVDITKPGQICITYSDPIDTSVAEWIDYTSINGSNELVGAVRGREGYSAHAHLQSATVAFVMSASHHNDVVDLLNGTEAGIKVKTALYDENGNEVIKTPATTSAVNEVTVTNSATGNAVQVGATGGDTDISLNLVSKGAGTVQVNGAAIVTSMGVDGWISAGETWTYASASTITVPSGAAAKYSKGDRIKFTQTTVKYGVIVAVADTLLTIAVNTDYTVANAAITLNYYSHQQSPVGYPHWYAYTPTINGTGGSIGTYAQDRAQFRYKVDGSSCTVFLNVRITNVGSWTGDVRVTTPITAIIAGTAYYGFAGSVVANNQNPLTQAKGMPVITDGNETYWNFSNNVWNAILQWSGIATSDVIFISGTYEI